METAAESRVGAFWRDRLGTIVAVGPLGVWVVLHLWNNLYAFVSPEAWEHHVTYYSSPFSLGLTAFIALGPLLYHALWGVRRIAIGRPNNMTQPYYANLKFLLQRLSALGVLAFVGAHLWLAMFRPRIAGAPERFDDIAHEMHHHVPTLVVYLLGTLGVAYHLANGLETALMKLGMRWPRRAGDRLELPFLLLFVLLLAMSWGTIYALYQAGA